MDWEVQLNGIPIDDDGLGKEVVVNWSFEGFTNNSTFYTDSNGLEMQKRILNYREDFKLETVEYASSNYYPIQSALALQAVEGDSMQLTVMNERSQGASVLADGDIEFMQNRRLLFYDSGAVSEPLNETDANGYGMQVNNRYQISLHDYLNQDSFQRAMQLRIDEPLQLFTVANPVREESGKEFKTVDVPDFDGDLKIHLIPKGKGHILIRLENVADLFDGTPAEVPMFALKDYAMSLWNVVNSGATEPTIEITERSLTDNSLYSEMAHFDWPTAEGPSPAVTYPED